MTMMMKKKLWKIENEKCVREQVAEVKEMEI